MNFEKRAGRGRAREASRGLEHGSGAWTRPPHCTDRSFRLISSSSPARPDPHLKCFPPSPSIYVVSPSLVTLSVTTVVPGWSRSVMAPISAMKRLLLMGLPCVCEHGGVGGGLVGGWVGPCAPMQGQPMR